MTGLSPLPYKNLFFPRGKISDARKLLGIFREIDVPQQRAMDCAEELVLHSNIPSGKINLGRIYNGIECNPYSPFHDYANNVKVLNDLDASVVNLDSMAQKFPYLWANVRALGNSKLDEALFDLYDNINDLALFRSSEVFPHQSLTLLEDTHRDFFSLRDHTGMRLREAGLI